MYFYNKLILSHKYEYYSLETWSNVTYFNWHATRNCFFFLDGRSIYCLLTNNKNIGSVWFAAGACHARAAAAPNLRRQFRSPHLRHVLAAKMHWHAMARPWNAATAAANQTHAKLAVRKVRRGAAKFGCEPNGPIYILWDQEIGYQERGGLRGGWPMSYDCVINPSPQALAHAIILRCWRCCS